MFNLKTLLFLQASVLTTALPGLVHAEDNPPVDVIVRVTREALPITKLGQAVNVLTDKDIATYQSLFIADLLAHTTDLSLSRNGGPGSSTTASLRGAGGDHTLYLLNGVRLNDPSQVGGGTNLGLLATDDASRIEVLRGPLSTLWGSGAIGGVVSITSRPPTETLEGDLRLEGFDQYGSARASVDAKTGALSWHLSASTYNDKGVSDFARGTEKDGFAQTDVSGRVRYDVSENLTIQAFSTTSHSRNDYDGYPPPDYSFADTGDFGKTDTTLSAAGLTHHFTQGEQSLSLSVTNNDRADYNPDYTPDFFALGHIEAADYHLSYHVSPTTRLLGGMSFERDTMRVSYPSNFDPDPIPLKATTTLTSAYGQVTHDFGKLELALSARHDDASSFGANDIAQVSVNVELTDHWRIHGSVGQGVKVPSLYQLYSNYGTSSLGEEKSISLDAGAEYNFHGGTLGFSLFKRAVRDQIDFVYDTCQPNQLYGCYGNINRSDTRGVELELSTNLADTLHLRGNYSFLHIRDNAGNLLPRRPDQIGSLDLSYTTSSKLKLGVDLRHVGEALDTAYTGMLRAYNLADFHFSYALNGKLSLLGRIENLGDTHYETAGGYGQTGRRVWLGIHTRLF